MKTTIFKKLVYLSLFNFQVLISSLRWKLFTGIKLLVILGNSMESGNQAGKGSERNSRGVLWKIWKDAGFQLGWIWRELST